MNLYLQEDVKKYEKIYETFLQISQFDSNELFIELCPSQFKAAWSIIQKTANVTSSKSVNILPDNFSEPKLPLNSVKPSGQSA